MRLLHDGDGVVTEGEERMKRFLEGIGVYDTLKQGARPEAKGIVAARMLTDHQEAEWLASQIEETAARVQSSSSSHSSLAGSVRKDRFS
jgi:hypothetical protein